MTQQPEQPVCGARFETHPESVCTEPLGHDDWHSGPLVADGRVIGGGSWGDTRALPAIRTAAGQDEGTCGSQSLPTWSGAVVHCVLAPGHTRQCQSATEYPWVSWPNPRYAASGVQSGTEAAGQDQPTTEVPKPLWSDLLGAAPDITGGACTQCYMDRARGREHDLSPEHAHCRTVLEQPEPTAPAGQDQPHDRRARIAATMWAAAEHNIVAEWICCEPLAPGHDLCAKGYAALDMIRALIVDTPEAYRPAPLTDAAMAVADTEQQELRAELSAAYEEANDLALHNDATCETVKERDGLLAENARLRAELSAFVREAGNLRTRHAALAAQAAALDDRVTAELAQARGATLTPAERASTYSECAERLRTRAATLTSSTLAVAYRTAADSLDCDADDIDPSRMTAEAQQTPSPAMDPAAILGIGADNPNRWAHRNAEAQQDTQPEEQPPVHLRAGANAEDCPACTNPPYPFICPGPTAEEPTS